MKEYKLLYQIKTLEKLIGRMFIYNDMSDSLIHLTPTQMQIIEYILLNQKENIYQKDLESILNLRRATVSGVLQTMEKNQLISRIIDPNDSRIKRIILNPASQKIFNNHEKIIIKDISETELSQFLIIIQKMQNNLKLVAKKERN